MEATCCNIAHFDALPQASTILLNAAVPLERQAQVIASLLQLLQGSGSSSSATSSRCLHVIAAVHTGGMRVKSGEMCSNLYGERCVDSFCCECTLSAKQHAAASFSAKLKEAMISTMFFCASKECRIAIATAMVKAGSPVRELGRIERVIREMSAKARICRISRP